MRLFAAVLPPAPAAAELASYADRLRELPGADELRWTAREGWHFTLAFLAEVAEETLPEVSQRMERAARRTPAFPLSLHGGGRFGERALWAGAAGDVAALRLLAARADAAARKAGVPMEEHRAYRPHLTLARARGGDVDLRPYVAALGSFAGTPWTVADLALVRSNLPHSGVAGERPRYEVVGRWGLGAPRAAFPGG
ncbi:RNA 2',3'-cyclic phosphodiesterase [Actinomycetota bacterium Odt1-20B]